MKELWKPIDGYEGTYEVSNLGRVKSLARVVERLHGKTLPLQEKILKQSIRNQYGHLAVGLRLKGVPRKSFYVHDLVAKYFIPNPLNYPEVRHGKQGRLVNTVDNLSWGTRSHNMQDAVLDGTQNMVSRTHCPYGHLLSGENIYKLQKRICIPCARARTLIFKDGRFDGYHQEVSDYYAKVILSDATRRISKKEIYSVIFAD